jgi:hypothetical protein
LPRSGRQMLGAVPVPIWDNRTALEGFVGDQTPEIAAIEETPMVRHGTRS